MRNSLFFAIVILLLLCMSCSSGPNAKNGGKTVDGEATSQNEKNEPTEEQIAKVMHDFAGIAPEHAVAVWHASEKAEDAKYEFRAFYRLSYKEKKENLALLSAAIRTHKEAKKLLEPLCKLYPHNVLLEDTDAFVTQGLRALERQNSVLAEETDKP
jgi:hypothetical protein